MTWLVARLYSDEAFAGGDDADVLASRELGSVPRPESKSSGPGDEEVEELKVMRNWNIGGVSTG